MAWKSESTLIAAGFVVNEADTYVYYRYGGGEAVMLCLYVDDILIFGSNLNVIKEVKKLLSSNLKWKIWEKLMSFLTSSLNEKVMVG